MKILVGIIMLLISGSNLADDTQLLNILDKIRGNEKATHSAISAGNERALLCKYCHGADGNSIKDTIPNLASQNVVYLIRQFELFASGKRHNRTMNELAKVLTPEDKVNIALFYSNQSVNVQQPYRAELKQQGKRLFEIKCFFCHGKDGYGQEKFPRIATQPAEYIRRTLSSYSSPLVKRAETEMSRVARALQPDEIEALASYLTTLK
jgi:cytochrome c553